MKKKLFFSLLILVSLLIWVMLYNDFYNNQNANNETKNILNENFDYTTLLSHRGDRLSKSDFLGYPILVLFGFTHCPDVCPNTLYKLSRIVKNIGNKSSYYKFYFITLDPDRDTVEKLSSYMINFNDKIVGITGTSLNIEKLLNKFNVYREFVHMDNGQYSIDHTASIYLLDKNGNFYATISYNEDDKVALNKISSLLKK